MTLLLRSLLFVLSCAVSAPVLAQTSSPVRVMASFSILADLVREVGGEYVAVHSLVGPEQDAHVYQPRPSEAASLGKADLVVVNGIGFEGWLNRLLRSAAYGGEVVVASDGIQPLIGGHGDDPHGHEHDQHDGDPDGPPDPHAWQDPRNTQVYVRNIAAALGRIDPDHQATYAQRAQDYIGKLDALDAWITEQIATVPPERRKVILSHASLNYYGERYGVQFFAAQGVSSASEPSATAVARLIRQARAEGVSAIFVEQAANPALARQIAGESGSVVRGQLYNDALSASGGPAPTYLEMMRLNTTRLVDGMLGRAVAPAR